MTKRQETFKKKKDPAEFKKNQIDLLEIEKE